jgi:hypothetical protein
MLQILYQIPKQSDAWNFVFFLKGMMNLSYGIVIHLVHAEISVKITTTYVGVQSRERGQEHASYHVTMSSFGY